MKIYPSAIDFAFNGMNIADYNSNCWRWILHTQGVKVTIDQAYRDIGDIHELWHTDTLTKNGENFDREVSFKLPVGESVVSGRCDFLLPGRIDETKATFNKQKFEQAPLRVHVAQLLLYLSHWQIGRGRLIYGHYEKNLDGVFEMMDTKTIEVSLKDDGSVYVGSALYQWSLQDLVQTLVSLDHSHTVKEMPGRPFTFEAMPACKFCPAKDACDRYSLGEISDDELSSLIRDSAINEVRRPAKYKTHKPPKVPKPKKTPKPRVKKEAKKCQKKSKILVSPPSPSTAQP